MLLYFIEVTGALNNSLRNIKTKNSSSQEMSESAVRSREEDDELQRSTKKVKENSHDRGPSEQLPPS